MTILEDFDQVTADSLQRIDDIFQLATDFKDTALTNMDTLIAAATAHIALLDAETFSPDYTDLDLAYNSPTDVTEPDYSGEIPADPTFENLKTIDDFSFAGGSYSGLIKTEMQTKFTDVFGGTLIVPAAIWTEIYERALERITAQQESNEWAAYDRTAALHDLPTESTLAALESVQEQTNADTVALIVEQAIAEAKERHADVWKAMEQGTPFETAWMSDHHREQDRELEAAKQVVLTAVQANESLIRSNDLLLRQWGMKWEAPLRAISAATERYGVRLRRMGVDIDSENSRRGYEALRVQKGLDDERGATDLAVRKAQLAEILVNSLTTVSNLMAAMAQGALAASDVSVGTGSSYDYSLSETA